MSNYSYGKPCRRESGLGHYPLIDAAGIFCRYVCEACEDYEKSKYNPAIFETNQPYSSTGNEDDLDFITSSWGH